jgi:hypothetical protein
VLGNWVGVKPAGGSNPAGSLDVIGVVGRRLGQELVDQTVVLGL